MHRLRAALSLGSAVAVALSSCNKPPPSPPHSEPPTLESAPPLAPPFSVRSLDLGKAVGVDNMVLDVANSFAPKDTVHLTVVSAGMAPSVVLRARWMYGGQNALVAEETQTIAAVGAKATPFQLFKASGLPLGSYAVQVFVNDKPAGVQRFVIAAPEAKKK
jgi:hypothetical protein